MNWLDSCSEKSCETPQIKAVNEAYVNDGKDPRQLVEDNRRLVHREAQKFLKRGLIQNWEDQEYDDLVGAGLVGLFQAARRFDPSKGNRFSSLAVPWIRGEMLHYLRDRGKGLRVPRIWSDYYTKGYGLSDEEAAAKNQITIELWVEVKQACGIFVKPWDAAFDRSAEPQELEENTPHLDKAREAIAQWLQSLAESDRAIVDAIYFRGEPRKSNKKRLLAVLATLPKP